MAENWSSKRSLHNRTREVLEAIRSSGAAPMVPYRNVAAAGDSSQKPNVSVGGTCLYNSHTHKSLRFPFEKASSLILLPITVKQYLYLFCFFIFIYVLNQLQSC